MPTIINSIPATFQNTVSPGSPHTATTSVTFAIPAGHWASATWGTSGNVSHAILAQHHYITAIDLPNGVGTAGIYSDSVAASVSQLAEINTSAGGSLVVQLGSTASFYMFGVVDAISSFTLTLERALA